MLKDILDRIDRLNTGAIRRVIELNVDLLEKQMSPMAEHLDLGWQTSVFR